MMVFHNPKGNFVHDSEAKNMTQGVKRKKVNIDQILIDKSEIRENNSRLRMAFFFFILPCYLV